MLGCAGLAVLLVAARRELRLAGLVAWLAGTGGLALYLAPDGRAAELVVAGVVGALLALAGGYALLRWPWALAFATIACIPIRLPVDIGDEDANLLLPLYFVIGSLVVALGWSLVRGDTRSRELGPVALPLAAFVAWTGLALLWSDDLRQGAIFLVAFVLPFGLLAIGFARLPWSRRGLRALFGLLVVTALAYATVGLYQWATREVFWNPKLKVDNAYAPFFRVNSVFWDPSIYGRYLVVAILATLGARPARAARAGHGGRRRCDRGALGRPVRLVFAVELRRPDRRHARGGGSGLALARRSRARSCRDRARHRRLRNAAGASQVPERVEGEPERRYERSGRPGLERAEDRP